MGLGYLHQHDIVHGNLQLQNILIDSSGYLKLINNSMVKMLASGEDNDTFSGNPLYMAPELLTGASDATKAADWWALGVTIYEMLFGIIPFQGKNKMQIIKKVDRAKVVFPDRQRYKIEYSEDIENLIISLLTKDVENRLGAKHDFVDVLSHPAFSNIDVTQLEQRKIPAPFKPDPTQDQEWLHAEAVGDRMEFLGFSTH